MQNNYKEAQNERCKEMQNDQRDTQHDYTEMQIDCKDTWLQMIIKRHTVKKPPRDKTNCKHRGCSQFVSLSVWVSDVRRVFSHVRAQRPVVP